MIGPVTINLVPGQAVYTLPTNIESMTDMYYSTVNGFGPGSNIDRIMLAIGRDQYVAYPNKLLPGTPSVYWYQKLTPAPQVTIYQVPQTNAGYPTYVLNYYALQRIQDFDPASGQTGDLPYRALDAICAGLAKRVALKFAADKFQLLKAEAKESWDEFAEADREDVPITLRPNLSGYVRD